MRVSFRAATAAAVLLLTAAVQGEDAADAERSAVTAASRAFSAAYVRNDAAAVGQAYTQDAVLMPPGREIRGRAAIQRYFTWPENYRQLAHSMTSSALTIRGDTAIDVGIWFSTSQRTGGQPVTASERYLAIWVREADGAWRMQYDMWHRPSPRTPPPATTD